MLDRRGRKVARDLWLHRGRAVTVVLAVATGLAASGAILNAWALIRRVTYAEFHASNPASATLRTDAIDAATLARARHVPGIRDAQAWRTTSAVIRVAGRTRSAQLLTTEDFDAVRIGRLRLEAGRWPDEAGTLVIERSALAFSGAAVGELALAGAEGTEGRGVRVTGVARAVGLAPGWMEQLVYGFVSRTTLDSLGFPSVLNELRIVTDRTLDREGVRRIAVAVRAELEAAGHPVTSMDVPEPGRHIHQAQMGSLQMTQGAFGLLALLCAAFLVFNLVTALLAGQAREIGVMKAMGADPAQIAVMYLALAGVLGLLAAGIAVPVAERVGTAYATLRAELLNFDLTGYRMPWWALAVQIGVGVLLPVAAAAAPVARACRMPVGAALRDVGLSEVSRVPRVTPAGGLGRPVLLSVRNAFRRRVRMTLTLLALAAGGATFMAALNLRFAVRRAVDVIYRPYRFAVTLRVAEAGAPDALERAVGKVAGVADAEAWSRASAERWHDDGTAGEAFAVTGVPTPSRLLQPEPVQGRWLEQGDTSGLVVTRGLATADPAFAVGDTVRLLINGRRAVWTVVGMVGGGPGHQAFASREGLARALGGDRHADVVAVAPSRTGEAAELDLVQRLRTELALEGITVRGTQRLAQSRAATEDHLIMVVDFLGVMAWVMVIVGGLGLASTMGLAVLERTREIGVLRAIGARHGTIHAMVQVEGLVIALLSWAVAIPLSIPLSVVLATLFGRIFVTLPIALAPVTTAVLGWLVLVVLVSMAACALPALRATRVTPAAALAYE